MKTNFQNYIIIDKEICHGKPTFKGTRIMVWQILEMLEAGNSIEQIIEAYPHLTKNHIKAALEFAVRLTEKSFKPLQK